MFKWFENLTNPFPAHKPDTPPNRLFAFCRYYSRGYEKPLILLSVLSACVAVSEVALVRYMGELVDILSTQDRQQFWLLHGERLVSMALLVLVGMPVLAFFHSMLMHQSILGNYPMSVRWQVHRYLLDQSLGFFQKDLSGRVATKVMQSGQAIRETVMKLMDVTIYIAVYFVSIITMLATTDWRLLIPILVWFMAYICIQMYYLPRLKSIATDLADAQSNMTGRIVDTYTNIMTVKLFSHSHRETEYAETGMRQFLSVTYRQMRSITCLLFGLDIANYLLLFFVASLSIWLWFNEMASVGVIAVGITVALRFQAMSKWIMWEIRALFENIGTVIDSMNTISNKVEVQDKPNAPALGVHQGEIEFQGVSFGYSQNQTVFKNLNLRIKPGEKVGIVGHSGVGKSTLVNLLLRFYDVDAGQISIDGQDISGVTQVSLRQQIAMVTQDTSLLHRSIHNNVTYGKPDATNDQIQKACVEAHITEFVADLRDEQGKSGYEVLVGERGVKLSGGQRQRIAIARVLLKNAPILILDEATSALDSNSESVIQENLQTLMKDKTVIAIAHRLSTISAMDRLIVLDEGGIAEQGTHQDLLKRNGIYAQLWSHQAGASAA